MNQQDSNYAIWLRPSQSELDKLTGLISSLSHQFRTIPFPMHITLLSGFSSKLKTIIEACKKVSETHTRFTINLRSIEYTEKYYMNLFILAEKNERLLDLHSTLSDKLKPDHNEEFIPHVSLLYGNHDEPKQQELKLLLADRYPKTIHCERIDVYNCIGNESQWYLEESFYLK
ncbi:MAG: 2'-5' RNA ligase family protein [Pseudomonadota bacterium]